MQEQNRTLLDKLVQTIAVGHWMVLNVVIHGTLALRPVNLTTPPTSSLAGIIITP